MPPQYFHICKKDGKKAIMLQERVGNSISCDPFGFSKNSWSIGENTPPQQVARHITGSIHKFSEGEGSLLSYCGFL